MASLRGKNMAVIGGSRGVGRRIVEAGVSNGARVLAVARQENRFIDWPGKSLASKFSRSMQGVKPHPPEFSMFLNQTSWLSAAVRIRPLLRCTNRNGMSSPSTGRTT